MFATWVIPPLQGITGSQWRFKQIGKHRTINEASDQLLSLSTVAILITRGEQLAASRGTSAREAVTSQCKTRDGLHVQSVRCELLSHSMYFQQVNMWDTHTHTHGVQERVCETRGGYAMCFVCVVTVGQCCRLGSPGNDGL